MKFRQISIILGIFIIIGAVLLTMNMVSEDGEKNDEEEQTKAQAVKVKTVKLDSVPAIIPISGQLEASDRIEIFAEVQGKFLKGSKPFKEGIAFEKGEVLIQIDDEEARLNLQAQKSNLMNSIASMLPDLKLDYPDHFQKWETYLQNMETDQPLAPLPKITQEQVKYFVSARNIYNEYYSIKSQENRLAKYTIRAPFDGIVTESKIDPGTLVRPGQELGQFISPDRFEIAAALNGKYLELIEKGDSVALKSEKFNGVRAGKVVRINSSVDPGTQTAEVYVATEGTGLKEGTYLNGSVFTGYVERAFELPRELLDNDHQIWIVDEGKLKKRDVEVAHTANNVAIVRGIPEGTTVLYEVMPSAYAGMPVKSFQAESL